MAVVGLWSTYMKTAPILPDGDYPFREDVYPLAELAMAEAPPELVEFLVAQARVIGIDLIRDEIVELVCKGDGVPEQRFTIYWPSSAGMHVLVPKTHVVGRA